jgi:hypothetical protein
MKPIALIFTLIFTAFMLSLAAHAGASPRIAPPADAPTCFMREYAPEYMSSHPGQKLDKMYVKLSHKAERNESGAWEWLSGEVVGVSKGGQFGNTAGCQIAADGSAKCMIECDGGSFSLRHSPRYPDAVNFIVTKDYYFPLYKNQMTQDIEHDVETISLDDAANRIYRLSPVDAKECDAAISRVLEAGGGGC